MQRLVVKCQLAALLLLAGAQAPQLASADLYVGSATTGFGGVVGGSTMNWSDDGTTVSVNFAKGSGNFNDYMVLYLDTGVAGRSAIGTNVNDFADPHRRAISYTTTNTLTFPSGFQASHAIALNTGFKGLWSIPSSGAVNNNGLGFIAGVGPSTAAGDASFNFSFTLSSLGLAPNSGAPIKFVATYLNPFGNSDAGFVSNEGYGSGFSGSNIGQSDFAFTGSPLTYVTAVPEASPLLFGAAACCIATAAGIAGRRLSRRSAREAS